MNEYKHTQIGYLLIAALGAATLFVGYLNLVTRFNPGTLLILGLMILFLTLFATLTTYVNQQAVNIRFGIGLIRKRFALEDVDEYRIVKNPWYYAWGIHAIPGGWIFNVSGWDAIELHMKNGRRYRIGTNDPQGLMNAIETSRKPVKS
jgi:hypothetical protein